jgi:hypothetical protein
MSKDTIRPLMKAVADLPDYYTGLALSVINALRGQDAHEVAVRLKKALVPDVQMVDVNKPITVIAPVDRSLSPEKALRATGRALNIDFETLSEWPVLTGDVVEMQFYKFGRPIQSSSLYQELLEVGLRLVADLVGQAAINQTYPQFAATHPNGTQIKNSAGKNVFMSFGYWVDEPNVRVAQREFVWGGDNWFPVSRIQTA